MIPALLPVQILNGLAGLGEGTEIASAGEKKRNCRTSIRGSDQNDIATTLTTGKDSLILNEFVVCVCHGSAKLMHFVAPRLLLFPLQRIERGGKSRIAAKASEFRAVLKFIAVVAVRDRLGDKRNRSFAPA